MVNKLIKIGTSAGVIIPKTELDAKGVEVGDDINFSFEPAAKDKRQEKLMREYDKFVKQYGQTLKNLAKK